MKTVASDHQLRDMLMLQRTIVRKHGMNATHKNTTDLMSKSEAKRNKKVVVLVTVTCFTKTKLTYL